MNAERLATRIRDAEKQIYSALCLDKPTHVKADPKRTAEYVKWAVKADQLLRVKVDPSEKRLVALEECLAWRDRIVEVLV